MKTETRRVSSSIIHSSLFILHYSFLGLAQSDKPKFECSKPTETAGQGLPFLLRGLEAALSLPLLGLSGRDALDVFLGVDRLLTAVDVDEILAALGDVEGLLVAGGIAELAAGELGNQGRGLGIVLDLADDLLHVFVSFYIFI